MARHAFGVVVLFAHLASGASSLGAPAGPSPGVGEVEMVLAVAVGKHWDGAESANLKAISRGHPLVLLWDAGNLETTIGLHLEQIECAASIGNAGGMFWVVRTREPFDRRKVLDKLVPKATESRTDQGDLWSGNEHVRAVCLADKRTLVVGEPATGQWPARTPLSTWVADRLALLGDPAASKTLLVLQVPTALVRELAKPDNPAAAPYRPLTQARTLRMKMEIDGGLRVTFRAGFPDAQAAGLAAPAVEKSLEGLNRYFTLAKTKMAEFAVAEQPAYPGVKHVVEEMTRALDAAQAGLREAKALRTGSDVEAAVLVNTDRPVAAAVLLMSLVPRPKKKA